LSEILKITNDQKLSQNTLRKHWNIKYWKKDFADLTKDDIDKMPARGMYQGTVWQYRWFVPFDIRIKGRNGWREELYFTIRSIFC
jgi:hypothetical protein